MTIASNGLKPGTADESAAAAAAHQGTRIGPMGRLVERITRPLTPDLYDLDLQMESADLDSELLYGRH